MLEAIKSTLLRMLPPVVAGELRSWRVRHSIKTFPARVAEHRYGSGDLKVLLADPLSEAWYDHDWPELPEVAALRQTRLKPGARVFDIGAHQGVVAMLLAREVGPTGQVVAVEPNPHNVDAASRNRALNGMSQIEFRQAAVSDRPGTLVFNQGLNGQLDDGTGAGGRLTVESVTIDRLAETYGPPDIVYIDVEGAEVLALDGARSVLASEPDFFIEVHVGCGLEKLGGSVDRLVSFFPRGRYSLLVREDEDDAVFRPYTDADPVIRRRFFLLARAVQP